VGTRGNGKTQMAVEAMRTATQRLLSAQYHTAISVFSRIKATFRKDSKESEDDIVRALLKPKLLVLDEVGKRGESDWENTLFFSIVDKRYGDMTDTILVANLEPTAFGECIGASLASRMNQTGGFILADWPSRR
jgi:DNA replication protein DnaC